MKVLARCLFTCGCLLIGMAGVGWAQLPPNVPFKWWNNPRVIQELGLSQDQIDKINTIWRDHRKTLIDLRAEHEKQQVDLETLLSKDTIDETAVLAKADLVNKTKADVERVTLQMRLRIRNVLTREQRERSKELLERFRMEEQQRRNTMDPNARPGPRNPRGPGARRIPPPADPPL